MEIGIESVVGRPQVLGHNSRFADHRNKVSVPLPAGNNVQVEMTGYSRPSGSTNVKADVKAIGPISALQSTFAIAGQPDYLVQLFGRGFSQGGHMALGCDHQVAGGVRKFVQDKEAVLAFQKDQLFPILISRLQAAKNAPLLAPEGGNIAEAPRGPHVIHLGIDQFP